MVSHKFSSFHNSSYLVISNITLLEKLIGIKLFPIEQRVLWELLYL